MAARTKARKRALDLLFEADLRGTDPVATVADRLSTGDTPVADYTVTLIDGVASHADAIDELIESYAEGWALSRMPAVDRALLRLAVYELVFRDDVPDAVVINEAVELAKHLSTDASPAYVNGILGRILLTHPQRS